MAQNVQRRVLTTGSSFPFARPAQRAARMAGHLLAQLDLGLVAGNATGVDQWASEAYCSEIERQGRSTDRRFTQLWLPYWRGRGSWWPMPGFRAPAACRQIVRRQADWIEHALTAADAAIMIGGQSGALDIARRFIDAGKTVLPVPFTGGASNAVFQDILRTWGDHPVPGLSRTQFLSLGEPWVIGAGPLRNLVLGIFADAPDIFISYRRADALADVGRLYHDLAEHFGERRVFVDLQDIGASDRWATTIEGALDACSIGIVVIGRSWVSDRLQSAHDVLRREVEYLIQHDKVIFPVLMNGAALPTPEALPPTLHPLLERQARSLDTAGWSAAVHDLMRQIDRRLRASPRSTNDPSSPVEMRP